MSESTYNGDMPFTEEHLQELEAQILAEAAKHAGNEELATVTPINAQAAEVVSSETPAVTTNEIGVDVQGDPVSGRRRAARPQGAPKSLIASPVEPQGVMGGRFSEIQTKTYKNGAKHVYGIDADGKKRHLSHDEIMEAYGYAGQYQGKHVKTEETPLVSEESQPQHEASTDELILDSSVLAAIAEAQKAASEQDAAAFHQSITSILERAMRQADLEDWSDAQRSAVADHIREQVTHIAESDENHNDNTSESETPAEPEGTTVNEPVVDTDPKTLRARAKRIFARAGAKLTEARIIFGEGLGKVDRYLTDKEKGNKRRIVLSSVVGAIAVVHVLDTLYGAGAMQSLKGSSHIESAHLDLVTQHATETLNQQGDTVWSVAEGLLVGQGNPHPSKLQILNEMQRILDLNNLSLEDARHLPVGTEIKTS